MTGSGGSPGVGNPLQYSRLENSMDRGAWQVTVHGVMKSLSHSLQPHDLREATPCPGKSPYPSLG